MGLTNQSTGLNSLREMFEIKLDSSNDLAVALAGNPNTGKSTVFNALTGLRQHTGNWPGKTVTNAQGKYDHDGRHFVLVDLPGTYSIMANSVEEQIARDFICFGKPHATVVVTDATNLERNLNLALQITEITHRVVVCVNLIDEAARKKIRINLPELSRLLGVPVVATNARDGKGLEELKATVLSVATGAVTPSPHKVKYDDAIEEAISSLEPFLHEAVQGDINARWLALRLLEADTSLMESIRQHNILSHTEHALLEASDSATRKLESQNLGPDSLRDSIVASLVGTAEQIATQTVTMLDKAHNSTDRKIDDILTSRLWGIPIMVGLLGVIFWLTIQGSNYPSQVLATGFFWLEDRITHLFMQAGSPEWLHGILVLGVYRTLAWVISVMLPPMAIFFPMFTLLEDLGYLPRVAFNMDSFFKRARAHGKQALTMCMGFGCNAAGVIACRIIDSPRERLIAIITNNFVPCNGRFPILIAMAMIFIAGSVTRFQSFVATLAVLATIVLGVLLTLLISRILSATVLKGLPSSFALELPPYRKPLVGRILVRSLLDRTLFVLGRAVVVAAPAGVVIWAMANIFIGDLSLLDRGAAFLQPFAYLIGLDGYILMAFILGLPANEIVIPIIIMSYMRTGAMLEFDTLSELRELLVANGWTWLTAVCTMLFTLNHWPCGTTLLTIKKETLSKKWTALSLLIPTITGIVVCFVVAQGVRLLGLL